MDVPLQLDGLGRIVAESLAADRQGVPEIAEICSSDFCHALSGEEVHRCLVLTLVRNGHQNAATLLEGVAPKHLRAVADMLFKGASALAAGRDEETRGLAVFYLLFAVHRCAKDGSLDKLPQFSKIRSQVLAERLEKELHDTPFSELVQKLPGLVAKASMLQDELVSQGHPGCYFFFPSTPIQIRFLRRKRLLHASSPDACLQANTVLRLLRERYDKDSCIIRSDEKFEAVIEDAGQIVEDQRERKLHLENRLVGMMRELGVQPGTRVHVHIDDNLLVPDFREEQEGCEIIVRPGNAKGSMMIEIHTSASLRVVASSVRRALMGLLGALAHAKEDDEGEAHDGTPESIGSFN